MRWILPAFMLLTSACSSCGEGAVPFRLDAGPQSTREGNDRSGDRPRTNASRPAGRTFPDGTPRVDVEGAAIAVDGSIRALWADDVDEDGDRDALLIASDREGSIRVSFYRREAAAFEQPRLIGSTPAAPGCNASEPALEVLGTEWLLARASTVCETHPAGSRRDTWIIGIARTPRALEQLTILDAEGRAPGNVALALSHADKDADGHEDLVVTASVQNEGEAAVTVELPWLDRPSGLARDSAEPERTFGDRAREALRVLRREPANALAISRGVLTLHEVLCREPGRARLRVGTSDGLSCGSSEGAGRAATTVVRAHAVQGQILEALAAMERIEQPAGLQINDERRQAARDAIAQAPATAGVVLREGPPHAPPAWSALHLSALAFLDEDRLLLRGETPRVWNIATNTFTNAAAESAELRILDPSRAFAVAAVERRCAGHVLRIVRAEAIAAGQAMGGTHSLPLLSSRDPPAGAPCPDLSPALRRDSGGFHVLGWAPQGVVAAHGADIVVVPLDVSAQPAGAPAVISDGTPPPAPLPIGAITEDGRFFVELRGLGVVRHRVAPTRETTLLWPEGWAAREGTPSDPAVSPSGRRVALLRAGRVLVLERTAR